MGLEYDRRTDSIRLDPCTLPACPPNPEEPCELPDGTILIPQVGRQTHRPWRSFFRTDALRREDQLRSIILFTVLRDLVQAVLAAHPDPVHAAYPPIQRALEVIQEIEEATA